MTEKLYKVLGPGQMACNGGSGKWRKNTWRSVKGDLVPCENGLHLCRASQLLKWLNAEIWEAEYEGDRIDDEQKIVVRRARIIRKLNWNERTARLFACDCAERALRRERKAGREPDKRSWDSVSMARRFANGEAPKANLAAAGGAGDAALDAAWAAARAARAAALDAAWAAARAAGDAALDAAWAAARAAGDAAWDARAAAWDAARAAAWDAARAAELRWQQKRLLEYLEDKRG